MDHFIHEQNLAHYRKVLSETTDPTKRLTVLKLLADEQASHGRRCRDEASLVSHIECSRAAAAEPLPLRLHKKSA
jgi:hypothetical protein